MLNNPFASKTYESTWLKYFNRSNAEVTSFDAIEGVRFIKKHTRPFYENIGKNLTNGMLYQLNSNFKGLKGKVAVIYDVPDYFPISKIGGLAPYKVFKVRQYKGMSTNLGKIEDIEALLQSCFSSKSKSRFKGRVRQIESTFKISHKVFYGDMNKVEYDEIMAVLKDLIHKRFDQRNEFNTVLPLWDFYHELIHQLVLEKNIAFHVVYDEGKPIALSINFVYDTILVVAIRTFDIEYYKYNVGNYEVYKFLEWCIDNKIKELDFSKGEVDYKKRWANREYCYEHHIIYDSKSIKAIVVANSLNSYYKFKQYLRDKNINTLYVKLKHIKKKVFLQS